MQKGDFLTIEQISEIFGISEVTARKECREGKFKDISTKVGRRYYVRKDLLERKFELQEVN